MGHAQLFDLGLVSYEQAWTWQKQYVQRLMDDASHEDCILLVEHPNVYTLGTGSTLEHVKFDLDDPRFHWHRIERGGEVTYHCPGQIVAYPILNLHRHQTDLHWYLRQLEEVIILTLAQFGLRGERIAGLTGVWVEGYKLAAIGIKVKRWITMHGLALNVNPSLAGFREIVPCGIGDRPVGKMSQFLPDIEMASVRSVLIQSFAQVFDLEIKQDSEFPFANG